MSRLKMVQWAKKKEHTKRMKENIKRKKKTTTKKQEKE